VHIHHAPRRGRWALAVAALLTLGIAPTVMAAPPAPSPGSAVVDGDPSEWSLGEDRFADLTRGGVAGRPVVGGLYLRYDCETETLYGLVLIDEPDRALASRGDAAYLRIGTTKLVGGESGNDGTPPDFEWVDRDGDLAAGFEASGQLAPGTYTIRSHVLILAEDEEDGYDAVDNVGRSTPLEIECVEPTPTPTPAPTEEPTPTATPTPAPTEEPNPTPTATPAPTEEPNPTPTPAPTEAPTATPTPEGSVAPATGTPQVTLPPTDGVVPDTTTTSPRGLGLALLGLGLLSAAVVLIGRPSRSRGAVRVDED
jgi:cell division septation protein DedD